MLKSSLGRGQAYPLEKGRGHGKVEAGNIVLLHVVRGKEKKGVSTSTW